MASSSLARPLERQFGNLQHEWSCVYRQSCAVHQMSIVFESMNARVFSDVTHFGSRKKPLTAARMST